MSVILRDLRDADSDLLFRWINDRDLVTLSAPFRPVSAADHAAWFTGIRSQQDLRIFAIADRQSAGTIGYCQLKKIDPVSLSAELQIRIGDASAQGKGAGTAAVRELLRIGFEELGLHRIYLHVFQDNVRAYRCYLKCGLSVEGNLREAVRIDGEFKNILMMSVLKQEFSACAL